MGCFARLSCASNHKSTLNWLLVKLSLSCVMTTKQQHTWSLLGLCVRVGVCLRVCVCVCLPRAVCIKISHADTHRIGVTCCLLLCCQPVALFSAALPFREVKLILLCLWKDIFSHLSCFFFFTILLFSSYIFFHCIFPCRNGSNRTDFSHVALHVWHIWYSNLKIGQRSQAWEGRETTVDGNWERSH